MRITLVRKVIWIQEHRFPADVKLMLYTQIGALYAWIALEVEVAS